MKRILFVITSLGCGGINRSLENLISALKHEDVEISVLVFVPSGQYSGKFCEATILTTNKALDYIYRNLSKQHGWDKLCTATLKLSDRLIAGRLQEYFRKKELNRIRKKDFDAVIAFSEDLPTQFIAPLTAKRKIAWVHCDYKSYLNFYRGTLKQEKSAYSKYDTIVCVSDYTKASFEDVMPECIGRVVSIPNVLDVASMKEQAKAFNPKYAGEFNIVTVGRIDPVKRQSVIPEILRCLLEFNSNVHWYVIGPNASGDESIKLSDEISRYKVENNIHLLGQQDNPYPYIKHADLLVNTSVSEACPYVINEAKVLATPVVCTDFGSAKQFVDNGKDGYSVPLDKMAETIRLLIENKDSYNLIKDNLANFDYNNQAIVNKFLSLI